MKKVLVAVVLVATLALCTGCWTFPNGAILAPIQDLKSPVAMGDPTVPATKIGKAQATGIIIVGWGDASIQTAAQNGAITRIHHVDSEQLNILGIYSRNTTVVYGQ